MLPLFVPPVATGLVLLMLFGRHGPLGSVLQHGFGLEIVFTWRAVVLACAVMSFPLLVRTAQAAFQGVSSRFEDIARTLGASEWRVFADNQPSAGYARDCCWSSARLRASDGRVRSYCRRRRYDSAQDDDDFIIDLSKYPAWPRCRRITSLVCFDWRRLRYCFVRADYFDAQPPSMSLRLHNIRLPLAGFTLEIDATLDRPIAGIFGPSGAGKTSLLDLIAGLRRPVAGAVQLDDRVLFDAALIAACSAAPPPDRLRPAGPRSFSASQRSR